MKKYMKFFFSDIKFFFILFLFSISMSSAILLQCQKNTTEPDNIVYPDANLSFLQHIHPIFMDHCAFSGCHESASPAGDLDLETLSPTFTGVHGPAVIPFNAQQSLLYRLLLSDYLGIPRMPKGRAQLADNKIRAIGTWIDEGAIINK
ncbi:MAG: hypothetical protein JXL67_07780 [Calditrichaeota bacterium]|nr:hypothetical protein [Calditrichota bacterium]